jgi:hypothetical protein
MTAYDIPLHFFFVDACRSDNDELNKFTLDGTPVLPEPKPRFANPDCEAPVLYASASGTQAFQPMTAKEGISLFGRATLEGLRGQAGIKLDTSVDPILVGLHALKPFARSRVLHIISTQYPRAAAQQHVKLGGTQSSEAITELEQVLLVQPTAPTPPTAPTAPTEDEVLASVLNVYSLTRSRGNWFPDRVDINAHDIFGSEWMTDIWLRETRLFSFKENGWRNERDAFQLRRVRRDQATQLYEFELKVTGEGSHWLQLNDNYQGIGCILPGDGDKAPPPQYVLNIQFAFAPVTGGPRRITSIEVRLDKDQDAPLGRVAELWHSYSKGTAATALHTIDRRDLEFIFETSESPLSAIVVALVLIRARRLESLGDWLAKLIDSNPHLPDLPVLWFQVQLAQYPEKAVSEDGARRLLTLRNNRLPETGEAMTYAIRQCQLLLDEDDLSRNTRSELHLLYDRLKYVQRFFRFGGLFSVYSGDRINPQIVVPKGAGTSNAHRGHRC